MHVAVRRTYGIRFAIELDKFYCHSHVRYDLDDSKKETYHVLYVLGNRFSEVRRSFFGIVPGDTLKTLHFFTQNYIGRNFFNNIGIFLKF